MHPLIEVTDRDGWQKRFPLERALVTVGSDPANDILLSAARGQGVEPRHLQILLNPQEPGVCRVVNVAQSTVEITVGGQTIQLAPRTTMVVALESVLRVGDFRLRLQAQGGYTAERVNGNGHVAAVPVQRAQETVIGGAAPTPTTTSMPRFPGVSAGSVQSYSFSPIGLAVRMQEQTLTEGKPAIAFVTVANRGDKTAVQIRLSVEGLPADCFEVPPLPLLFPGAEKSLTVEFKMPARALKAGTHTLRFIATAPEAYPGEQMLVQQSLVVPAVYAHTVTLRGPL